MAAGQVREKKKKPEHPVEEKQSLGRSLATARIAAGLKQEAVASELQVIKQTVSAWEKGRNLPDAIWLQRLARLYGTSLDAMVGKGSVWPFSNELQREVQQLEANDVRDMEVAIWAHLRKPVPETLHYGDEAESPNTLKPKPGTLASTKNSAQQQDRKTS